MGDPVTAVVVGSAVLGVGSASQQRRAQKRENREQQKLAAMENNRRIRQAQREARRARAVVEAQGSMAGQLASSSTLGVLGNIQNQIASNLEYMDNASQLTQRINNARQKQADWQAIGQLASMAGNAAMMYGKPTGLTPTQTATTSAPAVATQPTYQTFSATPTSQTVSSSIYR
jgi:hypothetical protein